MCKVLCKLFYYLRQKRNLYIVIYFIIVRGEIALRLSTARRLRLWRGMFATGTCLRQGGRSTEN